MGFADFDIMGKCKKILSKMDLLSEDIGNTLTPLVDVLGTTVDTGGTKTAGTAMAKLNALIGINLEHGSTFFETTGDFVWTCPEGVGIILVWAIGGSGGGGGGAGCIKRQSTSAIHGAGGGGSGSVAPASLVLIPVTSGQEYVAYIGAGGKGGKGGTGGSDTVERTDGENGGDGEATWFGGNSVAWGGYGGKGGTYDAGGAGGWAVNYWGFYPLINNYGGGAGFAGSVNERGYFDGGAGGGALCAHPFSQWGGAGGAGGAASTVTYGDGENGSNGTAGQCGRMLIIW